jgi:class 3 adenylate cyclase/tetratricopeptide (TPR) repeat protein
VLHCTSCGKESSDDARFCSACGARLEEAPAPRELRKIVTVLFCDVAESTAIGERLDPEPLRRLMLRWYEAMREVCEAHGGKVRELIGDAVMAAFGIPTVHEDDALRAVRAAAGMRERLEQLNDELEREFGVRLQSRTGINTGEVVVRDPDPTGALALGDAVNVAARLQTAAEPGEILLGGATHRLVRDAVRAEPVEPLSLKGKAESIPAFRLLEVLPEAEAVVRHFETPLVGRELELAQLRQAYERAKRERRCHLVTVFGPAGIGKTRLAQELARSIEGEASVLTGRCLSYGEGITYWPLREIVGQATGSRSVDQLLEGSADGDIVALRIDAAIGAGTGGAVKEDVSWAVRKLVEALAREAPLLLVFEDIHWGEPTLLDLIEYLADWVGDASVLLVCLARPELLDERPGWGGGKLNASSLLLEPLSGQESAELIGVLPAGRELPPGARERIAEAAEGNPLFLEQMLAMLAQGEGGESEIPPAIQALLAARLDRLEPEERELLERASIEGEAFHVGGIVALSQPQTREAITSQLMSLVRKELIRPEPAPRAGEDAFRFRHALIRDTVYESLSKEARSDLHERHAAWIEQMLGDRADEAEEFLGYHLEQAYRYRAEVGPPGDGAQELATRAGRLLASAGRRAFGRVDLPAAVNLFERALSLLPTGSPLGLELLPDLADARFAIGDAEKGESVAGEAMRQARTAGNRRVEWHAAVVRSLIGLYVRPDETDLDRARNEMERAIAVFDELNDDLGRSRAFALLFEIESEAGENEKAARAAERAIAFARRVGSRWDELENLGAFGWAMCLGPTPVREARERWQQLASQAGRDWSIEVMTAVFLAVFAAMEGGFAEARELMAEARTGLAEVGLAWWAGTASLFDAQVAMLEGDAVLAEHRLRETQKISNRGVDRWIGSLAEVELARAVYAQGRYTDAYALTEAFATAPGPVDAHWQIGDARSEERCWLLAGC